MRLKSKDLPKKNNTKYAFYVIGLLFFSFGLFLGWKEIPGFIKANLLLAKKMEFSELFLTSNQLDTLNLDIKFENFEKIRSIRDVAVKKGILIRSGNDFVNAKLSLNSQDPNPCKIRLKGDLPPHWNGNKWSLRINCKKNSLFNGMSNFSIQDPITRHFTYEWLFLENLRLEDILAPNYSFLNVKINGKKMGIYALEEHFSKEMIEKKNRREGLFLCFNEHHMWNLHWNVSWATSYRTSGIEVRDIDRVMRNPALLKQKENAVSLLRNFQSRKFTADQVLDPDKTAKFLALSHLWGGEHGLSYPDINFYYNPINSRLEPVAMDAKPEFKLTLPSDYFTQGEMEETWVNYALKSPNIAKLYTNYLHQFSSEKYLQDLFLKFGQREKHYRKLLKKEILFENKHYLWRAESILFSDPWENLQGRASAIRRGLEDPHIALFCQLKDKEWKPRNRNYWT